MISQKNQNIRKLHGGQNGIKTFVDGMKSGNELITIWIINTYYLENFSGQL